MDATSCTLEDPANRITSNGVSAGPVGVASSHDRRPANRSTTGHGIARFSVAPWADGSTSLIDGVDGLGTDAPSIVPFI